VKRMRQYLVVFALWAVWAAAPAEVTSRPVVQPELTTTAAAPAPPPAGELRELRGRFFGHLLAGRFGQALELLKKAPPELLRDRAVAEARGLTERYLKLRRQAEAERKLEYASAVGRVRLARLAQAYRDKLLKAKLAEKLYEKVNAVADAVGETGSVLKVNPTSQPAELRKDARAHLEESLAKLAEAEKPVATGHGAWGKAYRAAAESLRRALRQYQAEWLRAVLPEDWGKLKRASERVQDRLIDLGVLVSRDPLVSALSYAREAKELSGDGEDFLEADWVKELIRDAEAHGRELVRAGKWSEALTIYGHGGLSDLVADESRYERQVKKISLHVRMSNLYGAKTKARRSAATQAARTQPSTDVAMLEGPKWREMIRGIDTKMVRRAISQIDSNHVDRPDYRTIAIAALRGVKVLLETPQAAGAFPGLKDQAKRSAFVEAIDRQIRRLASQPTVDHLHVKAALNGVLDVNDRTVNLPPEVIDMEFTEAMLDELDKFTDMIWPYEEEDFRKRTMGSFCGIGVQIRKQTGRPIEVVTPLADTPALQAGIRAGDLILNVDGEDTRTISIERAVKLITGKRHTKVTLTIQRPGTAKPRQVTIVRDIIHIRTVKGWRRRPDGSWEFFIHPDSRIGYVRLTQFTGDTAGELRRALRTLRNAGARGVILDLRFNPGGLLTAAVDVADEFLRRGLIVRTKGRNVPDAQRSATALGEYQHGPLVVLANRFSASAAEIVAGALKDWHRATIVGERTYGKGSVQRLIPLQPDRPAKLKLTTAYYYLPAGRCIHRTRGAKTWGVDPDVEVSMTVRQMNRATEIRLETDLLKAVSPSRLSLLLNQQLREDLQLQTALLLLRARQLAKAA